MDGISSTPITNSVQFLRLRDKYKSDIFDDSRLTKAAGLAAKKELLLESPAPDIWKQPRLKAVNRELKDWVKKIRQPGGTRGITRDEDDNDDEDEANLAVGPFHQFMGNISKISKAIKRKAEPVTPQLQTPVIKQSPSTSEKPKFSFKTGSKAKRLLPRTPKKTPSTAYKTPKKTKPPSPASSFFSTADEYVAAAEPYLEPPSKDLASDYGAAAEPYWEPPSEELASEVPFSKKSPWQKSGEKLRERLKSQGRKVGLSELPFAEEQGESPWKSGGGKLQERFKSQGRALRLAASDEKKRQGLQASTERAQHILGIPPSLYSRAKRKAQRGALKKLEPAPGWKPFGTPAKRRLDGKDW